MNPPKFSSQLAASVAALCVFLAVLGAKWMTIDRFGSDIPNWDQWDAEGVELLAPWFAGDHFLQHLFHPHNEHRVVLTKLQALALVLLGGQWDSRVECVFNAMLHAALAAGFWVIGRRWTPRAWHIPLFVLLAAIFGLPLAWQNVLGGFHSQQYWLLGLSSIAIVWLPWVRPWSAAWFAAVATATLALLTMGSGFLASAVVSGTVALRLLRHEMPLRAAGPTLAASAAISLLGWLTRVEFAPHADLKAKTAHDFFFSLLYSFQWPALDQPGWIALLLWLPWLLVTYRALLTRPRFAGNGAPLPQPMENGGDSAAAAISCRAALTLAALGGWVVLQLLATAYARGAGANTPAPRYMDTLGFGMAVNALAAGWLLHRRAWQPDGRAREALPWRKTAVVLLAFAWAFALGRGAHDLLRRDLANDLRNVKTYYADCEAHLRGYLVSSDPAELAFDNIPYPSAPALIERLGHPALRPILPVSIRPPLPIVAARNNGFVENRASQLALDKAPPYGLSPATPPLASLVTWGSFGANGAATTGRWTSRPLTAPLGGWLKIETAGDLGGAGVTLELRDALTGAHLADVRPSRVPRDSWRAAYVRAPDEPFVIVADDRDARRWLAFSAPVEMSRASYLAWQAAKHGWLLVVAGAVGLLLAEVSVLFRRVSGKRG